MGIFLPILYFAICLWIISKSHFFSSTNLGKFTLWGLFALKCICGIALWAVYTYHYTDRMTADIYKYFDDARVLNQMAFSDVGLFLKIFFGIGEQSTEMSEALNQLNFWNKSYNYGILNDNQTIIRFQAVLHFFSFGHYHVHNVIFNFLSFAGLIGLFHFFKKFFRLDSWILVVSVFLIPSILFWGSGVLKDGLLLFALGMFIYFLYVPKWSAQRTIFLVLTGLILLVIKSYVLLTILPGVLMIWLVKKVNWKPLAAYSILGLIGIVAVGFLSYTNIYDGLGYLLLKQKDFLNQAALSGTGSVYDIPVLKTRFDVFLNSPVAFLNVLFRPMLWEIKGPLYLFSALENLFLMALIVVAFIYRKQINLNNKWSLFNWSFIVLLAVLIGLVTPVLGAVVRYKIPMLPFLYVTLFFILDYKIFYDKLPLFKKLRDL